MSLFKKRVSGTQPIYSREVDAECVNLMQISADLVRRIKAAPTLTDDERGQLAQDTFDAGVRWTRLSEGGYFVSVSEPYSKAMAEIVLGMNKNDPAHINKGCETVIGIAQNIQERNR